MTNVSSNWLSHLAIIMDGNGRWAQRRKKPRIFGHRKGVEAARRVVDACARRSIPYLTLYAFSRENWDRPQEEVRLLTDLLFNTLDSEAQMLHENGIRLRVIGDLTAFGARICTKIQSIESLTAQNSNLNLTVAVNYSGRWDITRAASQLINDCRTDSKLFENITEESLRSRLSTCGMPEPDLFIRTGGELRLSNFLLWELAYCELFFTDILWPEFNEACLEEALVAYSTRQRRFGGLSASQ